MKKTHAIFSIVLVLSLLLSLSVPALAAEDRVIDSWAWTKNNGLRNGILYLAPAHYMKNDILMRLPGSILINDGQELKVTWDDADFPAEGVSHGTYDFYVVLPEGYAQGKDCPDIYVRVIIVYPQYEDSGTSAPAPKTNTEPEITVKTETEGNSTTTTITHPDGTTDTSTTTTDENGNITQVVENRSYPDGYYTSDVYNYFTNAANTGYAYSVTILSFEGYENTLSPTDEGQIFRAKSYTRMEYDDSDRLTYKSYTPAIQLTDDPANPDYYDNSYKGSPIVEKEYYVYETDPEGQVTKTSVYTDPEHKTLLSESWSDDNGQYTKIYDSSTVTQYNYDTTGKLLTSEAVTPNAASSTGYDVDTTTYAYDEDGRLTAATTLTADGGKEVTSRTYYENGDYTQETYRYDSTTGEKGRILSSVGVNGMSGREVTRTTYHADGSSDTVEFKQHENGNTAKIITHTNADGSYTITRYDTEAGAELTSHHAAPKTEGTDPEPTGTETPDTETTGTETTDTEPTGTETTDTETNS